MKPRITLIIPAHNEAAFLPACLEAVRQAAGRIDVTVEIVVVLNRCTDDTERIARRHGCVIVREDAKNLSALRNPAVVRKVFRGDDRKAADQFWYDVRSDWWRA